MREFMRIYAERRLNACEIIMGRAHRDVSSGCHRACNRQDEVLAQSLNLKTHQAGGENGENNEKMAINNITKPLFLCLLLFNFASTSASQQKKISILAATSEQTRESRTSKHYNLLFFQFYSSENEKRKKKKIGIFI